MFHGTEADAKRHCSALWPWDSVVKRQLPTLPYHQGTEFSVFSGSSTEDGLSAAFVKLKVVLPLEDKTLICSLTPSWNLVTE